MIWFNLFSLIAASDAVSMPRELMYSLCHTETRIRNVNNVKDGGSPSYGICQVKLGTARQFFPNITIKELQEPYINIVVAATYLKYQVKRFKGLNKGISAYNAGRPIKGNKKYVNKVLNTLEDLHETIGDYRLVYR